MNKSSNQSEAKIGISIKFIFNCTADLDATRRFYSELIGLAEAAYNSEWGYLCYHCDGFDFMFFRKTESGSEIPGEWASQPGYEGGKLEITSWAIQVPEKEFPAVVKRLRASGARLLKELPEWRQDSYWGLTVMDPNGVTVEVYTTPKEKPVLVEWIDV